MFKAFTAGLFGIIFSASLGIFAATSAVNASAPGIDAGATNIAKYID